MNILRYLLLSLSLGLGLCAAAQEASPGGLIPTEGAFLRNTQERDSVLIGDQLDYGFLLKDVPEGTGYRLPEFKDTLMTGMELVRSWQFDTLRVSKARKGEQRSMDIEASIRITSFDEGLYMLPGLAALRMREDGADTLVFEPLSVEVCTFPIDTATFQVNDIKGQIRYPLTFKEILPYIGGLLLLAALIVLIVWLVRRRIVAAEEEKRREPAYIVALRKLDKYRSDKYWAPEKQKAFYSGITDTLREYMASRYGIGAMEMTTAEIFDSLKDKDIPPHLYEEMKGLFVTSDFVKFAKMTVDNEDNAKALPAAVRFVTSTYQMEVENEAAAVSGIGEDPEASAIQGTTSEAAQEKEGGDVL